MTVGVKLRQFIKSRAALRAIAIFKFFKSATLLLTAMVALGILRQGNVDNIVRWAERLRFDPGSAHFHRIIGRIASLGDRDLRLIATISIAYAATFLIEGTGLWLAKRWAEYMTTIVTASFIPFEVIEAIRRCSPIRVSIIVINIAIVIYLVFRILAERKELETKT